MINQHNAGDLSRSVLFVRGATFSICFHSIQALLVTTEGNSFIFDNKRSSLVSGSSEHSRENKEDCSSREKDRDIVAHSKTAMTFMASSNETGLFHIPACLAPLNENFV